jgi:hypothetical protein
MPPASMKSFGDCVTRTVADAYVVDSGLFLRWFVNQEGFEHARRQDSRRSKSSRELSDPIESEQLLR